MWISPFVIYDLARMTHLLGSGKNAHRLARHVPRSKGVGSAMHSYSYKMAKSIAGSFPLFALCNRKMTPQRKCKKTIPQKNNSNIFLACFAKIAGIAKIRRTSFFQGLNLKTDLRAQGSRGVRGLGKIVWICIPSYFPFVFDFASPQNA